MSGKPIRNIGDKQARAVAPPSFSGCKLTLCFIFAALLLLMGAPIFSQVHLLEQKEVPEAIFDFDIYKPTKVALESIKSHLFKGSILVFDELCDDIFPGETIALREVFGLDSVRIKWIAKKLGIEKLILKQQRMLCYFISDQQSSFYQSPVFTKVLQYVQQNGSSCVMKEKASKSGPKLLLTFIKITSVKKALETLQKI